MKRKLWRRLMAGFGILVVLLVILGLLAPFVVPADKVRDLVVDQVAKATGAEVRLGDARVRAFPRLRVVLADGEIDGTGAALTEVTGQPNPLERYRIAVESLEIDLALLPLLKKQVEIGTVRLVKPEADVVTRPPTPGGRPGADAGDSGAVEAAETGGGAAGFGLALAAMEIRDGRLSWRESAGERSLAMTGWNQRMQAPDLDALIRLLTGAQETTSGAAPSEARLTVKGEIGEAIVGRPAPEEPIRLADVHYGGRLTIPAAADRMELERLRLAWGPWDLEGMAILLPLPGGMGWRTDTLAVATTDGAVRLSGQLETGEVLRGRLHVQAEFAPLWPALKTTLVALGRPEQADSLLELPGRLDCDVALGEVIGIDRCELVAGPWDLRGSARLRSLPEGGGWSADTLVVATVDDAASLNGRIGVSEKRLTGRLRARADLKKIWPTVRSTLVLLGRPGLADSLPAVTGQVKVTAQMKDLDPTSLKNEGAPLDPWRDLPAQALILTARGRYVGVPEGVPGAPWVFGEVTLQATSPRPLKVFARGLEHPALDGKGDLVIKPRPGSRLPDIKLFATLARLDLDVLQEMMSAPATTTTTAARDEPPGIGGRLLRLLATPASAAANEETATRIPPGEKIPAELRFAYRGSADLVRLKKADYTNLVVRGDLREQVVTIDTLSVRRSTGVITGGGKIDYASDPWGKMVFRTKLDAVPTAALLEPYLPKVAPHWEGAVSGTAVIAGRLLPDPQQMMATLNITGDLTSHQGVYHAQQLLTGIAPYLGARQDLQDIRFKELVQDFKLVDGRYIVEKLRVDGLDTDWLGRGWIGLDGAIDLDLNVKLPRGFTPDLGQASLLAEGLRDDDGRITLDLRLTGRAASPTVALDLRRAKQKAEEALQESLEDEVKGKLGGLLDKLKGK